jgi:ketosteroid isomerase-like protein
MNKAALYLMIIGGLTLNSCLTKKQTDDPEKLKAVLMEYFDAIKAKDLQKMKELCTTDFVLFENGKIFNNDSLINVINSMPNAKLSYRFDNFNISVDNQTGYIRYYNYGDFTIKDTIHMTINWIESAAFKKIDNVWKLEFLHSTVRQ